MKRTLLLAISIYLLAALPSPLFSANDNVLQVAGLEIEGRCSRVFLKGDYVYLATTGDEGTLYFINIEDPQNPVIVNSLRLGRLAQALQFQGNFAYIAAFSRFYIADLNLEEPEIISSCNLTGSYPSMGVHIEPGVAYVLEGPFAGGEFGGGVDRINIADIRNPQRDNNGVEWEAERLNDMFYGWVETANGVYVVSNAPDREFQNGNVRPGLRGIARFTFNGLEEVRLSQPFNTANPPTAIAARGNILFTNGGFYEMGAAAGRELSDFGLTATKLVLEGDYLYAARGDDGFLIKNVSDPSNPRTAGSYDGGTCSDLVVQGEYIFEAAKDDGFKVYRYIQDSPSIVTSPRTISFGTLSLGQRAEATVTISNEGFGPLELRGLRFTRGIFEIDRAGVDEIPVGEERQFTVSFNAVNLIETTRDTLLIESNDVDGDKIVRVTGATSNVVERSVFHIDNAYSGGNYVLVGDVVFTTVNGITAVSFQNPDQPEVIGNLDIGSQNFVNYENNLLYTLRYSTLSVTDIADPGNMQTAGTLEDEEIGSAVEGFAVTGSRAVFVRKNINPGTVVVDVEDPENIRVIGRIDNDGGYGVTAHGALIFTFCNTMKIWDFTDPDNPELLAELDHPRANEGGRWGRIVFGEDYAYIGSSYYDYNSALDVVDLSDPRDPQLINRVEEIWDRTVSMSLEGRYLYLGTENYIKVFDLIDPIHPVQVCQHQPRNGETRATSLGGGLAVGANTYYFRVYDFNNALGIFGDDPGQRLDFIGGWNLISLNITPAQRYWRNEFGADPALMSRQWSFANNFSQLIQIKNQEGNFYSPAFGFNNIPFWNPAEAYWVKMTGLADGAWDGSPIDPQTEIPLSAGWNLTPYYPDYELSMEAPDFEAIAPILDHVMMMKDGAGNFAIPSRNYSRMSPLHTGQGYMLRMDEAAEFVYPERPDRARMAAMNPTPLRGRLNTGRNMSVLLSVRGVQLDDPGEIRVLTKDELCVGSVSIQNQNSEIGSTVGLAVWGDDAETKEKDGAEEGESLVFKLLNRKGETVFTPNWEDGEAIYRTDELSVGTIDLPSNSRDLLPNEFVLEMPYPNPFNAVTRIAFGLPEASQVAIRVFDITGREVATIVSCELQAGSHTAVWNAEEFTSGIYLVKMETPSFSDVRKVTLIK